jgi:hypothetical protein
MSMEENSVLSWLSLGEEFSIFDVKPPSFSNWFLKILKIIDLEEAEEDPCRVMVNTALQDKILGGSIVVMIPRTCSVYFNAKTALL